MLHTTTLNIFLPSNIRKKCCLFTLVQKSPNRSLEAKTSWKLFKIIFVIKTENCWVVQRFVPLLYEVRWVVLCLWHLTIGLSLQKSRPYKCLWKGEHFLEFFYTLCIKTQNVYCLHVFRCLTTRHTKNFVTNVHTQTCDCVCTVSYRCNQVLCNLISAKHRILMPCSL